MLAKKNFFWYFRGCREKDSWTVLLFRSKSLKMAWKTEKGKNRKQTAWNLFLHLFVLGPAFLFDSCPLSCASPSPPCCSIFPGLQFLVLGLSGPPPFLGREQERCCAMAVLLIKVNPDVISLYCSYHGISPGTESEAEDGPQSTADNCACKSAAGDKFWQIEIAEKFPC